MTLTLTTPATALALDWTAEVRGHLHLDAEDERARVEAVLIPAAIQLAQAKTERQLINATWTLYLDDFPTDGTTIELPKAPLSSVTHIKYRDTAGVLQTWTAAGNYTVVTPSGPDADCGYIVPVYGVTYPSTQSIPDAVEIQFISGYGATYASVPGGIRQAMLEIVEEMFDGESRAESYLPTLWAFRVWR